MVDAALAGAHVATLPFNRMFNHPLTDKGLAQFLKDREKSERLAASGQHSAVFDNLIRELPAAARWPG